MRGALFSRVVVAAVATTFPAALLLGAGCVKFSPEVKQTFEPQTAKEHSNFEPRTPPYGPIYVGPVSSTASLAGDGGADATSAASAAERPDAMTTPPPVPAPVASEGHSEGGIL
jgi:hypothetical protein